MNCSGSLGMSLFCPLAVNSRAAPCPPSRLNLISSRRSCGVFLLDGVAAALHLHAEGNGVAADLAIDDGGVRLTAGNGAGQLGPSTLKLKVCSRVSPWAAGYLSGPLT